MTLHPAPLAPVAGTFLVGHLRAPREALVRHFGPPQDGEGAKVRWEWTLRLGGPAGAVVTLYDWKGSADWREWSIGASDHVTGSRVIEALQALGLEASTAR